MNSLKPEIINLYKDRENHQAWLLANGMRQEDIQDIFIKFSQDQVRQPFQNNSLVIGNWFLNICIIQFYVPIGGFTLPQNS